MSNTNNQQCGQVAFENQAAFAAAQAISDVLTGRPSAMKAMTTKGHHTFAVDDDTVALADMARMFVRVNQVAVDADREILELRKLCEELDARVRRLSRENVDAYNTINNMKAAGRAIQAEVNAVITQLKTELATTGAAATASAAMAEEAKAQLEERDQTIRRLRHGRRNKPIKRR